MTTELFLDGANLEEILKFKDDDRIKGFTTNPSLMRKANVKDYLGFAQNLKRKIPNDKHVSLEVISDDLSEMKRQATEIGNISDNFYAKIPITNTKGECTGPIIKQLGDNGIKVNVTAIMTSDQVYKLKNFLSTSTASVVSVFAGRISDTGINANSVMSECKYMLSKNKACQLLWASCREVYSIYEANNCNCDIITASSDIINKYYTLHNKDLKDFSLETVKDFYKDALEANYVL